MSHYTMFCTRDFLGLFSFILVFYIVGAFLIKSLFHSRLLDMRRVKPAWGYAPLWLSTISCPTRARGIIVKDLHMISPKFNGTEYFNELTIFLNSNNSLGWKEVSPKSDLMYEENAMLPTSTYHCPLGWKQSHC